MPVRATVRPDAERRPAATLPSVEGQYTPLEVLALLERTDVQLIDVREPYEHEAGHIARDRLIGMDELAERADEIDRSQPVVFYCRTGARSGMATQAFRRAGFDAYNMGGGLVEWEASGLPLEPEDGFVADH